MLRHLTQSLRTIPNSLRDRQRLECFQMLESGKHLECINSVYTMLRDKRKPPKKLMHCVIRQLFKQKKNILGLQFISNCYLNTLDLPKYLNQQPTLVLDNEHKLNLEPDTLVHILSGLSSAGFLSHSVRLLGKIPPNQLSQRHFQGVIYGYLQQKPPDFEHAKTLLDIMLDNNMKPDRSLFAMFFKALCQVGKRDEARLLLQQMESKRIKPDLVLYTLMQQFNIYPTGIHSQQQLDNVLPHRDPFYYDVVIRNFAKSKQLDQALEWFSQMTKYHQPTQYTCLSLIQACDFHQLDTILDKLQSFGLIFNTVVRTKLMQIYFQHQQIDKALDVFGSMVGYSFSTKQSIQKTANADPYSISLCLHSLVKQAPVRIHHFLSILDTNGYKISQKDAHLLEKHSHVHPDRYKHMIKQPIKPSIRRQ
ncbi:hypothetical protein EDD86DRAFT_248738 [Gorgonomyces haynaldii]|nr:hypothetical protein EDD86DRAFT_248738 [Gorgonomyces haynaldii]